MEASPSITIRLDVRVWPQDPQIGVMAYDHRGTLVAALSGSLNPPHSVAAMAQAARLLVRAFLEPELGGDGDEHLHRVFEALTS